VFSPSTHAEAARRFPDTASMLPNRFSIGLDRHNRLAGNGSSRHVRAATKAGEEEVAGGRCGDAAPQQAHR
jgi:hypothetical protein